MADIFLSYSSKDRQIANHIQATLEAAGYTVFWDQETPPGRDWNSWIGEKLNLARLAIVLWSKSSVLSRNVVHEATIAVGQKKLIPVMVEELDPGEYPMGFYTMQSADLRNYRGQSGHVGMSKLLAAVEERLGKAGSPKPRVLAPSKPAEGGRAPPWPLILGGVAAVVLAVVLFSGVLGGGNTKSEDIIAGDPTNAMLGSWQWDGVSCGSGPSVTRDGELLALAIPETPTIMHAVESTNGATVSTIVVAPEMFRGTQYEFTPVGESLEVKTVADGNVETWKPCK